MYVYTYIHTYIYICGHLTRMYDMHTCIIHTYTLTYTSVDTYTLTYTSVDTYLSYTPVFNTCLHIHLRTNWSPLRVDTYIHMHTSLNQYPYTYM